MEGIGPLKSGNLFYKVLSPTGESLIDEEKDD